MKNGFIKTAAANIQVSVADVENNAAQIKQLISKAESEQINLLVLPELCLTGATCGDLFFSSKLINAVNEAISELAEFTADKNIVSVVGLPIIKSGMLYNCAAAISRGEILGIVPKAAHNSRHFADGSDIANSTHTLSGKEIPFGINLVFKHSDIQEFSFGIAVGDMNNTARYAAASLCSNGANIIAAPAAAPELIGSAEYLKAAALSFTAENCCAYIYSAASSSESTGDFVYSGRLMIYEGGKELCTLSGSCSNGFITTEVDASALNMLRIKSGFKIFDEYFIPFKTDVKENTLTRHIPKNPFIPECESALKSRAEQILNIQAAGLKKRIEITHSKTAVIGISGGLDSTLALLAAVRAIKLCGKELSDIIAVTMPCFGTTARTKSNAISLCEELGVNIKEINITDSVISHFKDISQPKDCYDVTFENAQARERTQVLMDIANMNNGLVIGTGDLSELALGWATYNGDHMSMYSVNCSVPKTLMRHIVSYEAQRLGGRIGDILTDIVNTPVSPELLPATSTGDIAQKTEDLVGPYELHDFFLYYTVRKGFTPKKIYKLATKAFEDEYSCENILHWLSTFTRRFFTQQFKRSCLPDGPAIGSISLSPRGAFSMPTDASYNIWIKEIEELKNI